MTPAFQPTLLGTTFTYEEESLGEAMIADEDETRIYVESDFFTGWMDKAKWWASLGIEGEYNADHSHKTIQQIMDGE